MTRRTLFMLAAASLSLAGCATVPPAEVPAATATASQTNPAQRLHALFKRSDAAFVERNPSVAFYRGDFSRTDRISNSAAPGYYAAERAAAQAAAAR